MTLLKKTVASCIMVFLLMPNIYAVYRGQESFPYTNAPMFGHYIGDKTYFYAIEFIGDDGLKKRKIYPYSVTPKNNFDYADMRLFFNTTYGSVEEKSPISRFNNDTSEELEKRIESYFSAYFKHLTTDSAGIKTVYIIVDQFDDNNKVVSSHVVGNYNVSAKKFTHTWKKSH